MESDGNPCEKFFREHSEDADKVKKLIACGDGPEWAKARLSASVHSPEPVADGEVVVRQVHAPVHWDGDHLKPGFYADLSNKGLSLNRLKHADVSRLNDESERRAASNGRSAIGFLQASVEKIEELLKSVPGGSGAVFDTAYEHDVSHADACQTLGGKLEARSMREALFTGLKDSVKKGRVGS